MTDLPDLKIKALVNFPADVIGDAGIDVNRIGGRYHLAIGYGDFTPPISSVPDPANHNVLIWNAITGEYKLASVGVLTGVSYEHLEITSIDPWITLNAFSTGNNYGPWLYMNMTRGTSSSPLPVNNGDYPFGVYVGGYDGAVVSSSASIDAKVDGPVSVGNVPIAWIFNTGYLNNGGTERLRIDSLGHVGIGMTPVVGSVVADHRPLQVGVGSLGVSGSTAYVIGYSSGGSDKYNLGFQTDCFNPDGYGDGFTAFYSRGTRASPIIVNSGDTVGGLFLQGWDGIVHRNIAKITAVIDGAPAAGDMPGRLEFATTLDGQASPTERLRINNAGHTIFMPGSAAVPTLANGQFTLTPTSNTNMRISHRGSDGVLRVANFTML